MPYVSNAQRAIFHEKEKRGEISPATVAEFDKASVGLKLPEHVKRKPKKAERGRIGDLSSLRKRNG